jgi:ABC-type antimicrobial peptide transport system permease subunit
LVVSAAIGIGANAVVFGFIGHLVDPAAALPGEDAGDWQSRLETIRTLLVVVAMFVFAIAGASVAGLLLSRGAARVHETSVRVALGAHGRDLLRPLLAEGALVAAAAIAFGLVAAFWTVHGLPAAFYEGDVEALPFVVDWRGLLIATVVGSTVVFAGALAPLAWTSRRRPAPDSRGTGPGLANTFGGWRSTLVIAQLTLCAVLLVSTGAVVDHLRAALRTDHAQRTGNAIVARVETTDPLRPPPVSRYTESLREGLGDVAVAAIQFLPGGLPGEVPHRLDGLPESWRPVPLATSTFDANALRGGRLRTLDGRLFGGRDEMGSCPVAVVVDESLAAAHLAGDAVGRVMVSPEGTVVEVVGVMRERSAPDAPARATPPRLWVYGPQGLRADGHAAIESWNVPSPAGARRTETLRANVIDGANLDLVGLSLVQGRTFDARDTLVSCGVALVNEEAAAQIGAPTAIGMAVVGPDGRRSEIVGVVRESPFRTLQPRAKPTVFYSSRQRGFSAVNLIVRVDGRASGAAVAAVTARLVDVRGGKVTAVTTLQDHLQQTSAPADRLITTVVQAFAGLAVLLSLIGVTGVTSDAVARRTPEIALRMALGAPRWRIVADVVTYGTRLAVAGSAVGVALCLAAFRLVEPLPDGGRGPDLWIWAAAPLTLVVMVVLGTLVPARRALAVEPSRLLREP